MGPSARHTVDLIKGCPGEEGPQSPGTHDWPGLGRGPEVQAGWHGPQG